MSKHEHFIIPITDNQFLVVIVWKHRRDYTKATGSKGDACFVGTTIKNRYPLIGEVHFIRGLIGSGIVAHELTHASRHFVRMHHMMKNEEYVCESIQVMTNGFWRLTRQNKRLNRWIYNAN